MTLKIFGFNGSLRGNKSIGDIYYKSVIDNLNQKYKVESKFFDCNNFNIDICRGCSNCFDKNIYTCNDDMEIIRKEMLDSDIIFFITPVYLHAVSGTMKLFLDKIALWSHYMTLSGKFVIIVTVSESNGNDLVNEYLNNISSHFGLITLQTLSLTDLSSLSDNMLNKSINSYAKETVKRINRVIKAKSIQNFSFEDQEENFKIKKILFSSNLAEENEKYNYWANISKNHSTFRSYFNSKCDLFKQDFERE